jgi:hypothetical protein
MLAVLEFIFRDLFHFVGFCVLLWLYFAGLEAVAKAFTRSRR